MQRFVGDQITKALETKQQAETELGELQAIDPKKRIAIALHGTYAQTLNEELEGPGHDDSCDWDDYSKGEGTVFFAAATELVEKHIAPETVELVLSYLLKAQRILHTTSV